MMTSPSPTAPPSAVIDSRSMLDMGSDPAEGRSWRVQCPAAFSPPAGRRPAPAGVAKTSRVDPPSIDSNASITIWRRSGRLRRRTRSGRRRACLPPRSTRRSRSARHAIVAAGVSKVTGHFGITRSKVGGRVHLVLRDRHDRLVRRYRERWVDAWRAFQSVIVLTEHEHGDDPSAPRTPLSPARHWRRSSGVGSRRTPEPLLPATVESRRPKRPMATDGRGTSRLGW